MFLYQRTNSTIDWQSTWLFLQLCSHKNMTLWLRFLVKKLFWIGELANQSRVDICIGCLIHIKDLQCKLNIGVFHIVQHNPRVDSACLPIIVKNLLHLCKWTFQYISIITISGRITKLVKVPRKMFWYQSFVLITAIEVLNSGRSR